MRFRQHAGFWGLFVMALFLTGCASPPDAELTEAQAALDNARQTDQADTWAPEEYGRAKSSLDAAKTEIEAQNERFGVMRNYDKAKQDLDKAKSEAAAAQTAAAANKQKARDEANTKLQDAVASIEAARQALAAAPVTKDTRVDIQLFTADLDGLDQSLAEVRNMISGEDYRGASVKADTITQSANDIMTKLTEARDRLQQRKR
jgi:DNA repair exonuclease SbcCD ATPase subunit